MEFRCAHCGRTASQPTGAVNRARKAGLKLYCDRRCASLGRRTDDRTQEQKRADKAIYDAEYRAKNRTMLAAKKAAYHARTYDPAKQRIYNQSRMAHHVEYCRRPEYREKKKAYDHVYNAKRDYGPLWEIQLLTLDIRAAVLERQTDYDIRLAKGGLSKSQKRKRDYDQILRNAQRQVPQVGAVGNLAQRQGRHDGAGSR